MGRLAKRILSCVAGNRLWRPARLASKGLTWQGGPLLLCLCSFLQVKGELPLLWQSFLVFGFRHVVF